MMLMQMLTHDGPMTVALAKSVIGTTYFFDYCVASGFDRYGHTKSVSESDGKYGSFLCFVQHLCRESHLCNFTHMEKLKCNIHALHLPPHSF